jgi:hypothetical protein
VSDAPTDASALKHEFNIALAKARARLRASLAAGKRADLGLVPCERVAGNEETRGALVRIVANPEVGGPAGWSHELGRLGRGSP